MINIRHANPHDIETLVGFQMKMALETEGLLLNVETLTKGIQKVLMKEVSAFYLLAEMQSRAVACCMISFEWSDWRCAEVLWLQSVYVVENSRGKGVFRAMYAYIKHLVNNTPEYAAIRLYVDKNNKRAAEVYTSSGMDNQHYEMFEWMKKT
ncbi:MAG TPA: GNAT family N-acetyltransferase [Bacteroidales bacterium]|nr:GNAT family N-acetyltransferase [Bacteroidales bacterium]